MVVLGIVLNGKKIFLVKSFIENFSTNVSKRHLFKTTHLYNTYWRGMNEDIECSLARRSYRNDSLVHGTPYMDFSIFLLAWTFAFFFASVVIIITLKQCTTLDMKISWLRIFCFDFATLCFIIVGPIRDLIGYEVFICDFELWARTFGVFSCIAAFNLEITFMRNKLRLAHLLNQANFQTLQEFAQRENNKVFIRSDSRKKIASMRLPALAPPMSDAGESHDSSMRAQLEGAFWTNSKVYQVIFVSLFNLMPLLLCCLIIQLVMPFYGHACVNCLLTQYHMAIVMVFGTLPLAMLVYGAWKLRNEPDPHGTLYSMMRDLAVLVPIAGTAVLIYCLNWYVGSPIDNATFSPDWLLVIVFNLIHYLEVVHPIWVAMRPKTGAVTRAEFDTMLLHPDGLALYTKYLESEYNAENIRFYMHCKAFREHFQEFRNAAQAKIAAEELYWTFCHQGAILQVNLPDNMRTELFQTLAENSSNPLDALLFERAEREIYQLMLNDSYQRFAATKQYKQWAKGFEPGSSFRIGGA